MQTQKEYFPYLDGVPFISGFLAWILISLVTSVGLDIIKAAIICLPYGFAFYCMSSIKSYKKNILSQNQSVILIFLMIPVMVAIDEISREIFEIPDAGIRLALKIFIMGMLFWSFTLATLFGLKVNNSAVD
jgi:type IV secretory pathway TraG/TraD family ATPase VirD4